MKNRIALTIDDGLCRGGPGKSMIAEVRDLLRKHGVRVTFMLCSDYVVGLEEEAKGLLEDGHEFGNHCPRDREYASMPEDEFKEQLLQTNQVVEALFLQNTASGSGSDSAPPGEAAPGAQSAVRWFRAPQARYTSSMREAMEGLGLRHVLGDTYCDDWAVEDADWIARTMLRQVGSGSVAIMHMPERGFREHILEALRLFLEGLDSLGLCAVTMSELAALAGDSADPLELARPEKQRKLEKDGDWVQSEHELPQVVAGIRLSTYRGWPTGGYQKMTEVATSCSEEEARKAAFASVQKDPVNCVVEVVYHWSLMGGSWTAKAYTADPGQTMTFTGREEGGSGTGYMVYHTSATSKPEA